MSFFLGKAVDALRGGEVVIALSFSGRGLDMRAQAGGNASPGAARAPVYMLDPWEVARTYSEMSGIDSSIGTG